MEVTLGDRRENQNLDNCHVKDLSAHRKMYKVIQLQKEAGHGKSFRNISSKSSEKEKKRGEILSILQPYNKDKASTPSCVLCLDYLAGLTASVQ